MEGEGGLQLLEYPPWEVCHNVVLFSVDATPPQVHKQILQGKDDDDTDCYKNTRDDVHVLYIVVLWVVYIQFCTTYIHVHVTQCFSDTDTIHMFIIIIISVHVL